MNLRYELKIIDLDMPQNDQGNGNVIVHEYSSDIKDVEDALIAFDYELGEVIGGQNEHN